MTTPAVDSPGLADTVPPTLLRLVYTSHADRAPGLLATDQLLADSRRANASRHLSGLLLRHQGHYIQCLEGPPEAVRATYARIQHDPRHHGVTLRYHALTDDRSFGSWYMAYAVIGRETWAMLDGVDWTETAAYAHTVDGTSRGLSRGFALLERVWDLYRDTPEADKGPPGD